MDSSIIPGMHVKMDNQETSHQDEASTKPPAVTDISVKKESGSRSVLRPRSP